MNKPRFFYFDLGRVLLHFDNEQMFRQIAAVAGVSTEQVRTTMLSDGLMRRHEIGELTTSEFFDVLCGLWGVRPDYDAMVYAASAIFSLNLPMLPLVSQLRQAGYRTGVLSNTCEIHWQYSANRFRVVGDGFQVHALSCRIKAMKPDAAIYLAAAEMAGCRPDEVFFVDDLAENVAGARAAGFDAVQFTSAEALAEDLRKRGVAFNY
jgi:FMN phosphatase YigB (HAD superfamily)